MEQGAVVESMKGQLDAISSAPVPFLACIIIVAFVVWKALSWRYETIIERQKAEIVHLDKMVSAGLRGHQFGQPTRPDVKQAISIVPKQATPHVVIDADRDQTVIPANVTPQVLIERRKGLTTLQAQKAFELYFGKSIEVAGTVADVRNLNLFHSITLKPNGTNQEMLWINCIFTNNTDQLTVLSKDNYLVVYGVLDSVSDHGITIKDCRVLRIGS